MDRNETMTKYFAALIALSLCLLGGAANTDTVYVSLSGRDGASGTATAPWRTIQHAVNTLKPGDMLLIGPGIYRERIEIQKGGTAQSPITIAALPGARVVVSGADRLKDHWSKVHGAEEGVYVHDW